jgi:hypothetical protein
MPDRPYTGRRWRFGEITGTVCSEPFSIVLGQANGNGLLWGDGSTAEMTHGCVAVSLDIVHRHTHRDPHTGTQVYIRTIIGHVDDVDDVD